MPKKLPLLKCLEVKASIVLRLSFVFFRLYMYIKKLIEINDEVVKWLIDLNQGSITKKNPANY